MQGRHRNRSPNDEFRSGYRGRCGDRGGSGGVGFSRKPYLSPPPPPRKEDILMEAGRLAAEYLAYKGLLPSDSPSPKRACREFKGRDRDPSPTANGRDSALDRLSLNRDTGNGRRRYEDEYGRNEFRGWKRYSSDWGRDNGRWSSRNRNEEEDDYPPRYRRDRRSGFDYVPPRSEVDRRSGFDHMPLRRELTGESGSEIRDDAEDTGSKASSSRTRKEPLTKTEMNFSKVGEGGQMVSLETVDGVKSGSSGDSKRINVVERYSEVVEGDDKCDRGFICGFPKVPTKPRASVLQKNATIDQEVAMEECIEPASGEDPKEGSSTYSHENQTDISKTRTNDTSSVIPTQPTEEYVNSGQKSIMTPVVVTEGKEMIWREGAKRQREPSPEDEDEYSRQDNLRAKQSNPKDEMYVMEDEKVTPVAVDLEKSVENTSFPEIEPEEEKQTIPNSFKIRDLNLMGTPETTEISDDPVLDHLHATALRTDTGKETSIDFGISLGNNGTREYSQLPSEDKMIQVIDLEDDSLVEANPCDPSKSKDESMIHPNQDNFLSHMDHVDLPGIQHGYSPALSEFLGSDISHCPSVPSAIHSLQAGVGLNDAEGVPNDDDSIYVSLGEIPIGFMEVWDQPPPDYGKLF